MEAIVNLLKAQNESQKCPLLVCGFQEVIPELSETVLKPMLKQAGYTLVCQPGNYYKCALAVHDSVETVEQGWHPFPDSVMKRGLLYVQFRLPTSSIDDQVLFATTHLESPTNREGTTNMGARVQQIRAMETFCNNKMEQCSTLTTAIISGDLNWDEQARDVPLLTRGLESEWKDAWMETHIGVDEEEGFTFDCPLNPFLDGDRRCRLDRILVRNGSLYQANETFLIGQDPMSTEFTIQKHVYDEQGNADGYSTPVKKTRNVPIVPSDHFGVVACFTASTTR